MKILIINGPNLNLLGSREPDVYGKQTFASFFLELTNKYKNVVIFDYFQSNVEGELINKLQEAGMNKFVDGIIANFGGYSHTSVAIADAVAAIQLPVVEVHISNVYSRENFRQRLLTAKNCCGVITGFGLKSYELAVKSFLSN
ncbi:MAG: 3-dehydroquinate dehydratase [Bacteroidales bacterium]|nr:3-dehydroquinate dehydratase [Bacteroidales bacterium]MDD2205469.1 3-dehydroquinate dehydratase [Bacteroidales bacterium]MDD3914456.1 3-dehydroquinate dehydratase [Bacteroidales bacterium]MDD4634284.1 3-dehydroquinate dehydratase [Bacteroidales bacterium]